MRLVIFGKTGQVGAELARYPFPSDVSVLHFGREDCDVEDFRMTALAIRHSGADVLINATGYSDAVKAESERERARALNANVPRGMAKAASELPNCPIIQLSTADVYAPGASGPLTEDSDVDPQSTFARTKEAGERAVMRAHEQHIILRTSWVFGAAGQGIVQRTLAHARSGGRIEADAQRAGPTPAQAVADACVRIAMAAAAGEAQWGVFNFCGAPPVTRAEFLQAILDEAGERARVETTPGAETINAVLDCSRIKQVFGLEQPDWRTGLKDVVKDTQRLSAGLQPAG